MNQNTPPTEGKPTLAANIVALMYDLLDWQEAIERALRDIGYLYTFDDVVASVLRQERHVYQENGCLVIMQVDHYPSTKAYHCFLAAGTTYGLLELEPKLAQIGKELGCSHLSFAGRKGWERRLKNHGWQQKLTVMHKEIK